MWFLAGIIQGDVDDWRESAIKMASIYENAFVTIAATWSKSSNGGCFSKTPEEYQIKTLGESGLYAAKLREMFPVGEFLDYVKGEWPLLKRGWVFQERCLSPRIIHYAENCLYWECDTVILSEDGIENKNIQECQDPNRLPGVISQDPLKFRDAGSIDSWQKVVSSYTRLQFTFSGDLVPALAGIVEREMRSRPGDVYIAGVWKEHLLNYLCCYSASGPRPDSHSPTWSWTHLRGAIRWRTVRTILSTFQLLDLTYTPIGPANFGEVMNASIRVIGPTISVQLNLYDKYGYLSSKPRIISLSPMHEEFRLEFYGSPQVHGDWNIKPTDHLTILMVSSAGEEGKWSRLVSCHGILLKPTLNGKFEKIGAVSLNLIERLDILEEHLASLPLTELEIV
jgi:hypothetical protein